jgi:hypothetical protein
MALAKKGVYFTLLSTIFVTVLVVIYLFQQPQQKREESFILETRITTMNDLLVDISEDAGRMLYVTTFRALVAMEDNMANSGKFITNVQTTFNELFVNGTINGTVQQIMVNNTYPVWRDRMTAQASKIGVALGLSASTPTLAHSSAWDVTSQFTLTVTMTDSSTGTSWNAAKPISTTIHIEEFEDPVYRLKTSGKVVNNVYKTNITDFVQGNTTTNLQLHTNNSWYREWNAAPSFLQRFEGKLNESSPYGIESIVNLQELSDAGIQTKPKSVVDYIYFSTSDPKACKVDNMPNWWKIDGLPNAGNTTTHPYFYEVEGLINPGCT